MPVRQRLVSVPVRVRLAGGIGRGMTVLVMSIVRMTVFVFHGFV